MGLGEFITCGTMFRNEDNMSSTNTQNSTNGFAQTNASRGNFTKDAPVSQQKMDSRSRHGGGHNDVERQMLNNEYLKILKDPKFADVNVNFMDY